MATDGKARAKGVDLPPWWMKKVRSIVDDRKDTFDESLVELGALLATAVGRPKAWNHSSVSRFLKEVNLTVDMAEAFAALFGIPKPFYVPDSMDEALALQQVSRRYEEKQLNPEQERRLGEIDQALDAAKAELKDQNRRVGSHDEVRAARGGGRGRGTVRGRS